MNTLKRIAAFAVISTSLLAVGIGGWKLERWLNWKLEYGHKVDRRMEQIERRVTALERGHRIVNGVETCERKNCTICNR